MAKLKLGTESGLGWPTIRKYAGNPLLERDENDAPIYFHRANCIRDCKNECNGDKGTKIAADVATDECHFED